MCVQIQLLHTAKRWSLGYFPKFTLAHKTTDSGSVTLDVSVTQHAHTHSLSLKFSKHVHQATDSNIVLLLL